MSREDEETGREHAAQASSSGDSVNDIISQLVRLLNSVVFDKGRAEDFLERLSNAGTRQGFTESQATSIIQLALRGIHIHGKTEKSRIAVRLIKCIHPARGTQLGQEFVLTILGALGPSEDALVDANDRFQPLNAGLDQSSDEDSDGDHLRFADSAAPRKRKKSGLKVQASALKLLVLLLHPVHILEDVDAIEAQSKSWQQLPSSLLTSGARKLLDRSYGILFHYLDYQTLRPFICHLLYSLTRQKHVRQYRTAKLILLRSMSPADPYLDLLLAKYAQHSPQLHYSTIALGMARPIVDQKAPRYPDARWLMTVKDIWNDKSRPDDDRSQDDIKDGYSRKRRKGNGPSIRQARPHTKGAPTFFRTRGLLPQATFHLVTEGKVLVTEVTTCKGLGYLLPHLQLPDHLATALTHQMTQIAVLTINDGKGGEDIASRISRWVISAIVEEMNLPASKAVDMLESPSRLATSNHIAASTIYSLASFVEVHGYFPDHLRVFINDVLNTSVWSRLSVDEKKAVLKLVESIVPLPWKAISSQFLGPLMLIMTKAPSIEAAVVLNALRKMLERWIVGQDWSETVHVLQRERSAHVRGNQLTPGINYIETISETIGFVLRQADLLLLRFQNSIEIMDAALRLYECIFDSSFIGFHTLTLPPRHAFNLLTTSQYGAIHALSRMSGILKQILDLHIANLEDEERSNSDVLQEPFRRDSHQIFSDESRDAFNGSTEHLFGMIWRGNAFGGAVEMGAFESGVPPDFLRALEARCHERGQRFGKIGSISHGAILGPLMEAHANTLGSISQAMVKGPITAYGLNQASKGSFPAFEYRKFRHRHIDWLGENGAIGLREFFQATFDRFEDGDSTRGRSTDQSTVYNYSEGS